MKPGLGYSSFRAAVPSALQTFLGMWMELTEEVRPPCCRRHRMSTAGVPCCWEGLLAELLITPSLNFTGTVSLGNVLPTADIAQFKQGVKSVAGKMAVLANGVMNSLQVRLGYWTWEELLRFAFYCT